MNMMLISLLELASMVMGFIVVLIFIWVIMSWLVGFGMINLRNPMVSQIYYTLNRILNPIMAPVQRVIPAIGGLDLSPIVVLIALQWLQASVIPRLIFSLSQSA